MSSLPLQVATGILCASYWRGSWYILDHTLFPDDRIKSGVTSLTLGSVLLSLKQYILSPSYNGTKAIVRLFPPPQSISLRKRYIQTNRFIVLYGIASACVLIWRGTWLLLDEGAHQIATVYYAKYREESIPIKATVLPVLPQQQQNGNIQNSGGTSLSTIMQKLQIQKPQNYGENNNTNNDQQQQIDHMANHL